MTDERSPLRNDHRQFPWISRQDTDSAVRPLGLHVIGDFQECCRLPDDEPTLRRHLETAANLIGATIVQSVFHRFSPFGLSGVVVIAESHLSIHTWPEYDAACVDLFTCSPNLNPQPGFEYLKEEFGAGSLDIMKLARGRAVCLDDVTSVPSSDELS